MQSNRGCIDDERRLGQRTGHLDAVYVCCEDQMRVLGCDSLGAFDRTIGNREACDGHTDERRRHTACRTTGTEHHDGCPCYCNTVFA